MQAGYSKRLADLRAVLRRHGLDGFIVPRADEHLGEYVAECSERLSFLTGFTGSAGSAVVLAAHAAVFSDGRYILQLAEQTDGSLWERLHITEQPPAGWIAARVAPGMRIGYDPWLMSEDAIARYTQAGLTLAPVATNPVDEIWADRPQPPAAAALPHPLALAGETAADKAARLAEGLHAAGEAAAVISDPASIAWLLNIRGSDVAFTPFALGFALLHADAGIELFMLPEKLPEVTRMWLGNKVTPLDRNALQEALHRLAGKRVRVDPAASPAWFAQTLRAAGAEVVAGQDPCMLPKAMKNRTEQDGARQAHVRDAVAVCRFLHWLDERGPGGLETEMSAAARLLAFRREVDGFRGESFPAISGAGEHGAIIHYRVTPETDRAIRPDELYLCDSGAQFIDGTTDITRTIWTGPGLPPDEVRSRVTRVLQGHIAIATLVFPQGVAGPHIDALARRSLWEVGLDFDHGTGHGVGSFLSVHEGPVSLSRAAKPVPIAAGMILSDEPGFYLPGAYGIRLENLLLVQPADLPGTTKPFLRFEPLTLAPFDRRLIDRRLLTVAEADWIDSYHQRVLREIRPRLDPPDAAWLSQACAPLARTGTPGAEV
jgi:Xaa-Pro aminopeptidase